MSGSCRRSRNWCSKFLSSCIMATSRGQHMFLDAKLLRGSFWVTNDHNSGFTNKKNCCFKRLLKACVVSKCQFDKAMSRLSQLLAALSTFHYFCVSSHTGNQHHHITSLLAGNTVPGEGFWVKKHTSSLRLIPSDPDRVCSCRSTKWPW